MTGVEVTPFPGVTCLQRRVSLKVSPAPSNVACHRTEPVSASKAYTESCSVAANTTLCREPEMLSRDTYRGWASTLPSTERLRSKPKLDDSTFAGVSAVSVRFWPLRLR